MLGSDEGLREYLWDAPTGMRYALGSLATAKFGRYIVTILFDMFFTVILFKYFYGMLVQVAGFSEAGRACVANAFVSGFIGVITFQVNPACPCPYSSTPAPAPAPAAVPTSDV